MDHATLDTRHCNQLMRRAGMDAIKRPKIILQPGRNGDGQRERERDRERECNMMDATNLVKRPQWRRLLIGSPRRTLPRPLLGDNQLASVGWKYPRHGWQPFLEPAQNDAPSVSVAGVPPGGVPVPYPYNHPHLTVALASQSHYRV